MKNLTRARYALPLVLCLGAVAQSPADTLAELLGDERLFGGRVGVKVVDLGDRSVLAEFDGDKGLMPASNMKLISTAVALFTLGPDFRFRTVLEGQGAIENGVLLGDLYLVGSGDPTLGARQEESPLAVFERFAGQLQALGVTEVKGSIYGDDHCQPDEIMGKGWSWDYQSHGYAAQVSGLCFAENVVKLFLSGTEPGKQPAFRVEPQVGYVDLVVDLTSGEPGSSTNLWPIREPGSNVVLVRGTIAADSEDHLLLAAVDNPTRYAARALREVLRRAGIQVSGPALDLDDLLDAPEAGERTILAEHRSAPLAEILGTTNKVSQNLYAEQLIRAASREALRESDIGAAQRHAREVLEGLGVDVRGLAIDDGSGLTRRDLVHPDQLVDLLIGIWSSEHRDLFLDTLPVAGVDGTLSSRFREGPAREHVRAKTGSIDRVAALSGYVLRPGDDASPIVFSVLLNNFTCSSADARDAIDRFVSALARHAGWGN